MSFKVQSDESASILTLFMIPPPKPLDWESPSKLIRSIVRNYAIQKFRPHEHYIGHVNLALESQGGEALLTGQTSNKNRDYHRKVFTNQMDLRSLLLAPQPGRVFTSEEIRSENELRSESGHLRILRIHLKPGTMRFLFQFFEKFVALGKPQKFGGLDSNPLLGDAPGCSSLAQSFVRLAGLGESSFTSDWQRTMRIRPEMIDGPDQASFWSLILRDNWTWADDDNKEAVELKFWEPGLMVDWATKLWEAPKRDDRVIDRTMRGKAQVIDFDATDAKLFEGLRSKELAALSSIYGFGEAKPHIAHA